MKRLLVFALAVLVILPAAGMSSQRQRIMFGGDPLARGLTFYAPLSTSLSVLRSSGNGTPTFTRAASGTYTDSTGTVQTASSGASRFDYGLTNAPNVTGGFLSEFAATNNSLQSQTFDSATWVKTSGSVSADFATAPDGTLTADKFTASGANATIAQSITSASSVKVHSVWIKRETGSGAVSVSSDGTTFTAAAVTGTWTRFADTRTSTNPTITIKLAVSGDAVDLWGDQDEAGAVPTSYIVTTGATATRALDSLTYPASGNATAAQGSVSCWVYGNWPGDTTNLRCAVAITLSNTNAMLLYANLAGPAVVVYGNGASQSNLTGSTLTASVWNHLVATWDSSGVKLYQNGALAASTATVPVVVLNTVINVGGLNNSIRQLGGLIAGVRIYNRALSATEDAVLNGLGVN